MPVHTAVDLPARWIAGLIAAGAVASLATITAGIRLYERLASPPERPSTALQPLRATPTTPVPHSGPRAVPGGTR